MLLLTKMATQLQESYMRHSQDINRACRPRAPELWFNTTVAYIPRHGVSKTACLHFLTYWMLDEVHNAIGTQLLIASRLSGELMVELSRASLECGCLT